MNVLLNRPRICLVPDVSYPETPWIAHLDVWTPDTGAETYLFTRHQSQAAAVQWMAAKLAYYQPDGWPGRERGRVRIR